MNHDARWALLGAFAAAVGAVGCGRAHGGLGGTPAEQAPDLIAQAVCPKAYDCCQAAQLMGNDLAGTDEPSCEQKTRDAYAKQVQAVLDSQEKFRSEYDGTKLDACLSYIRSNSCQTLGQTNHFSGIPGCDSFVQPRVNLGGTCTYDWECIKGHCAKAAGAFEGQCQALTKDGQDCTDVKCDDGLLCDAQSKTCVAPLGDGATCARSDQCGSGSCNADPTGGAGATTMTCGPRKGGACFYASACAYGGPAPASLSVLAVGLALLALGRRRRVRRAAGTARPRQPPPGARTR